MNLPTHKPTTSPPHKLAYYSFGVGDFLSCLSQRGGHKLPHKDKERDTEDQDGAGLQKIRIEL